MGGKGRIVTAAVLHMKNQGDIKKLCLQRCVGTVRAQNVQNVLGSGQLRTGRMHIQTVPVVIMIVCLIAVNR